jgi:dihydroxyacetone kinase DhaKLM complex PTS-EIIA-like component DhaM
MSDIDEIAIDKLRLEVARLTRVNAELVEGYADVVASLMISASLTRAIAHDMHALNLRRLIAQQVTNDD